MFQSYEFYCIHSVKSRKHLSQSMTFIRSILSLITTVAVIRGPFTCSDRSRIWKFAVIGLCKFRLALADACGRGTRDESPKEFALEATKPNRRTTSSFQQPS